MISLDTLRFVVNAARDTPQRDGCLAKCEPDNCLFGKCIDDECAADPDVGYAPGRARLAIGAYINCCCAGCADLLCDLMLADQFLAGTSSCVDLLPKIDATPRYAGGTGTRQCGSYDALIASEKTQTVDRAVLAKTTFLDTFPKRYTLHSRCIHSLLFEK